MQRSHSFAETKARITILIIRSLSKDSFIDLLLENVFESSCQNDYDTTDESTIYGKRILQRITEDGTHHGFVAVRVSLASIISSYVLSTIFLVVVEQVLRLELKRTPSLYSKRLCKSITRGDIKSFASNTKDTVCYKKTSLQH